MKKKNNLPWVLFFIFLALALIFIITSCNEDEAPDETQKTVAIDKHGSIDVKISQTHIDFSTIIKTEKYFYDNNAALTKYSVSYDTVSGLGVIKDTLDTGRTEPNDDGDDVEVDTVITHHKNYQFFITVK